MIDWTKIITAVAGELPSAACLAVFAGLLLRIVMQILGHYQKLLDVYHDKIAVVIDRIDRRTEACGPDKK